MGNFISNIFHKLFGKKQLRILMVGLDGAGKTTILYKLKLGQVIKTIPTIGFNVETLEYKNIVFTVWDVGGQDKLRRLWRHYYQNSHAIIFVVDSSDRDRVDEVANELRSMMMGEFDLQNCVLLIFANKQDMNNALTCEELTERLKLHEISQKWYIQPTCAVKGDGLHEGFDWLCNEIVESPQN